MTKYSKVVFTSMLLIHYVFSDMVISLPLAFMKDQRERYIIAMVLNLPNTVTI